MNNFLEKLEKIQSKIERSLVILGGILALSLMFLVTIDVFMRKFLNRPIPGTIEFGQLIIVGIVFLGIAFVQKEKGHVNVEIATNWLPYKGKSFLDIISCLIGLITILIITIQSGKLAWSSLVTGEYSMGVINFPLWPSKILVPIGMGLLSLRLFWDLYFYVASKSNKKEGQN